MWIVVVVVLVLDFASSQTTSTGLDVSAGPQVSTQTNTGNGQLTSGFPANFFSPYFSSYGPSLPLTSSADTAKDEKTTSPQQLQTSFNLGGFGPQFQSRPLGFGQFGLGALSAGSGGASSPDVDSVQPGAVVGFYGSVPNIGGQQLPAGATPLPPQQHFVGIPQQQARGLPQQQQHQLGLFGNGFPSFSFDSGFPGLGPSPTSGGAPVTSIQDTINKPGAQ